MKLIPGENDARHIASGVDFIHPVRGLVHKTPGIQKVIITQ